MNQTQMPQITNNTYFSKTTLDFMKNPFNQRTNSLSPIENHRRQTNFSFDGKEHIQITRETRNRSTPISDLKGEHSKSTLMESTITQDIKKAIVEQELEIMRLRSSKFMFKITNTQKNRLSLDKLMRVKDQLKAHLVPLEQRDNNSGIPNAKQLYKSDKPRQVRFGSVAYLIQKPRDYLIKKTNLSQPSIN